MPRWLGILLAVTLGFSTSSFGETRYTIPSGADDTLVRFDSKATMESFHGDTHRVSGYIVLDPTAITDSIEVRVEVDMASLDTGIGKRNKDMRQNHLHTDEFPTATFVGARLVGDFATVLTDGEASAFDIIGAFTLHGITRELTARAEVTHRAGDAGTELHVICRFPVDLNDFDITRPKFLFLKLAEEQQVTVDVIAHATPPEKVAP